jgi:hypothetical protein
MIALGFGLFASAGCGVSRNDEVDAAKPPVESTPVEEADKLAAIPALAGCQGTYKITEVLEGSHQRKEVIIGSDGSIDFDENIKLRKEDYTLAEDRRDVNGCIVVEVKGQEEGKIARLDILFDTESKGLRAMRYLPGNDGAEGLIEVEF